MAGPTGHHDNRRQSVAEDYARAVRSPSASCCCSPVPKGVVASVKVAARKADR